MYVISVLVINCVIVHLCWKLLSEPENSHVYRTAEYIFEKACAHRFGSVYTYSPCTLKHTLKLLIIINVKNMMVIRPIVTYASETWVLKETIIQKLLVFERKILRGIFGPTK